MFPPKPLPPGAWDTHVHVFEPDKFPLAAGRHFTPAAATLEELRGFEAEIGVRNVCIAHGLSYGADCTSLLSCLQALRGRARGICVLDRCEAVPDETLDAYHAAGVRSVRLDFFRHKALHNVQTQIALIRKTDERLRQWEMGNWSIQIQQPHLEFWTQLRRQATEMQAPLVVDHLASIECTSLRAVPRTPDEERGYEELLAALRDGNTWMKISAPYRCSDDLPHYQELQAMVRQMVDANPDRVVWGSDWPHTQRHKDRIGKSSEDVEPFLYVDDNAWIQSLSRWFSEKEWRALWIDNPCRLYDCPVVDN